MEESDVIVITEEEAGERLDKILAARFKEVQSRTYFQYLIDNHLVLLNGQPVKKRIKPKAGDEVEVEFVATPEAKLIPESIPLDILYEDEGLIVVNKPTGMVVHPAPGNWSGTFVNALLSHCQILPLAEETLRPGIVHRLDKETSGVLVAAKTIGMQQRLVELFSSRQVYKEYLAICVGNPGEGKIEEPIGRHPIHRKQMAIVPHGRPALSFYKALGWNEKLSIVRVVIATGRTHQIRVHLKHRGTPVLGDPIYGHVQANKYYQTTHQFLHAYRLAFKHPATGERMEFEAPIPEGMANYLNQIDPQWRAKDALSRSKGFQG